MQVPCYLLSQIQKKDSDWKNRLQYRHNVTGMETMPDHVHLLLDVDPKDGVFEIVNRIRGYTSFGLSREFPVSGKPVWSPPNSSCQLVP